MGIFAAWREKYKFIKLLVEAQKTIWYPILFAALCIISGVNNYTVYIPIMWVLVSFVLFSALFTDDNKVFFVPLCMIYFALGSDAATNMFYESSGDFLASIHPSTVGNLIAMGVVAVGSFVARLILDGSVVAALNGKRRFTMGIIAMDVAFLLNGIFSSSYDPFNIAFGAMTAAVLTLVYILACGITEKSEEPVKYGCISMLCAAYTALIQILIVVYRLNLAGLYCTVYSDGIILNRNAITLGWGVSTVVGAVLVLGIPAAMYLAKNCKASFLSFISCPILLLGTLIIDSRGPMVVGAAAFIVFSVLCCIKGANRVAMRIYVASFFCLAIGASIFVISNHPDILSDIALTFRFNLNHVSGRNDLWDDGMADFFRQPIFGAGFSDGGYPIELKNKNFYSNMYHCIIVQWLGATGIVGMLSFLWHATDFVKLFFKKFTIDKLFLLGIPAVTLAMSLFDNFFFYPHFQIFYAIFLALAEYSHNISNNTNEGAI